MSKLRVSEALEMFEVSQSGIYRDMDKGIISYEKDERGKKVIDVSELQRVYELRENGDSQKTEMRESGNSPPREVGENGNTENGTVVAVLEEQVALLKEELGNANEREKDLRQMLKMEQEKTRMLMLTPSPRAKGSFFNYFRLKR